MDRVRPRNPLYMREKSISSIGGACSPLMSPVHHHPRSGTTGLVSFKRSQHYDAKTAAQKLAQVMAHQRANDEDDDGDVLSLDYVVTSGIGLSAGKEGGLLVPRRLKNANSGPCFMGTTCSVLDIKGS